MPSQPLVRIARDTGSASEIQKRLFVPSQLPSTPTRCQARANTPPWLLRGGVRVTADRKANHSYLPGCPLAASGARSSCPIVQSPTASITSTFLARKIKLTLDLRTTFFSLVQEHIPERPARTRFSLGFPSTLPQYPRLRHSYRIDSKTVETLQTAARSGTLSLTVHASTKPRFTRQGEILEAKTILSLKFTDADPTPWTSHVHYEDVALHGLAKISND